MNKLEICNTLLVARKTYFSQKQGPIAKQEVLHVQVLEPNLKEGPFGTVSIFHKYYYTDKFAKLETKCCNPFNNNNNAIKNSILQTIT